MSGGAVGRRGWTWLLAGCLAVGAAGNVRAVTRIGADASSSASASLGPGRVMDASAGTFWSSAGHDRPDRAEWVAVEFDVAIPLGGVSLTPRVAGGATLAFPEAYRVEYGYDDSGERWFPVPAGIFTNASPPENTVTHNFAGQILARRIRVVATRLRPDNLGGYYFQLAELDPVEGAAVFPFQTSAGPGFDAQMNMMWSIYGSVSDGSNAVFTLGNEPAWHEWMAIKYGWSDSTRGLFRTLRDDRIVPWPQSNDGYVWSWNDRETWPTGRGSFHNENNAKYILGAWRSWTWERNDAWFDRIDATRVASPAAPVRPGYADISGGMSVRQKLRLAMRYLERELKGELGGLQIEDNGMNNTGTPEGDPTNYWDNWKFGYKNAYDNIYYYAALEAMAQLEQRWGDAARAAQLRAYRQGCKAAYDAEFWNPARGRYICTIDRTGRAWDFGSTFVNLEALAYGLGDAAKARSVFDWLDGRRVVPGETSTGADIYFWRFAPRANTIKVESIGPPYWWEDLFGAIRVDNATARWPNHLENGGAIFYTSYYDLMARLRHLGADNALARLQTIVGEFEVDQLRRDPTAPGSAPWQIGIIGEFPESGLVPCALVYGFAGVEPDSSGLNIVPRLPTVWSFLTVRRVVWAGAVLDVTVRRSGATIASDSKSLRTVYVHGRPIPPGATERFKYDPGGGVRVLIAPSGPALATGDFDQDGDVDLEDFSYLQRCLAGPGVLPAAGCERALLDQDDDVDQNDVEVFRRCLSGTMVPADPDCDR